MNVEVLRTQNHVRKFELEMKRKPALRRYRYKRKSIRTFSTAAIGFLNEMKRKPARRRSKRKSVRTFSTAAIGLPSFPNELLRNILLFVTPKDLRAIASANRHLHHAVPSCIDQALAHHHIAQLQSLDDDLLRSIPFDHPVLFEHSVAAISRFAITTANAEGIWGQYWRPFGMDAKTEAIRMHRVRELRTALERRGWPSRPHSRETPSERRDDMKALRDAAEMAGLMRSLDLLEDLRRAFPDDITDDFNSRVWRSFFFASAESGYCEGLNLIPQQHPVLLEFEHYMTLLGAASTSFHAPAVELLLAKGAPVNPTSLGFIAPPPLCTAVCRSSPEIVELLLKHGADVHYVDCKPYLHYAVGTDEDKPLRLLLKFGADPEARDYAGCTALMEAATLGNCKCVSILLNAGAKVDVPNQDGRTPLMMACHRGHADVVRLLLKHGANVNYWSLEKDQPIHLAVYWDHGDQPGVLKALLDAGAQVNTPGRFGNTPLYMAMDLRNQEVLVATAMLLLDAGADPTFKSRDLEVTPLGLISWNFVWNKDFKKLLERFMEKGVDLKTTLTDSGHTVWERLCGAKMYYAGLAKWMKKYEGLST
ncbi:hypothetical protein HDU96_001011 [Phlyctochytrium bullatum]|nr:hypothetical protein HDU96_001011 [Phlyctochytrium bullatum]